MKQAIHCSAIDNAEADAMQPSAPRVVREPNFGVADRLMNTARFV
jgi:hypothetical protein